MSDSFTSGQIAGFLAAPAVPDRFYERRVRTLITNGLIVPTEKTQGGHLRFSLEQVAMAAVYSEMLDMNVSHPTTAPGGFDQSPFTAAQFAATFYHRGKAGGMDRSQDTPEAVLMRAKTAPNAITRALQGTAAGEWWAIRIDHARDDQTGARRFIALVYDMDKPERDFPMPLRESERPVGSILLDLKPILLPLVTPRGGMN